MRLLCCRRGEYAAAGCEAKGMQREEFVIMAGGAFRNGRSAVASASGGL